MVEIQAVCHQFGFESRTVVVHLVVNVAGAWDGYRLYRHMLSSFVADQHFCIYAGRISLVAFGGRQGNGQRLFTFGRQGDEECQFIRTAVAVQVIQLRGDFFITVHDNSRAYTKLGIDFTQFDHYRFVCFCLVPSVAYFHCKTLFCLLCLCCYRESTQ